MKRRSSLSVVWVLLILLVTATAGYAFSLWRWLDQPVVTQVQIFEVPQGASVIRIGQSLRQQVGMAHPRVWSLWIRQQGLGNRLRAGEYQLQAGMTPRQLVQLLTSGDVLLRSLTVVEGSTFAEFRAALAARDDVRQTLHQVSDDELMRQLSSEPVSPEAQFFPDTYRFARGTPDIDILRVAYQRMQKELQRAWNERDPSLPLASPQDALILASIVEKESALASERPVIAGLFLARLARNMKLQTDPTVIYGLGATYDGRLHKDDLLRDTPYNTYTRFGLPPTPICLPGLDALRAATQPQKTDAVYFVANGTGDGSHTFSRTLDEHNAAVQRYLKRLRGQ